MTSGVRQVCHRIRTHCAEFRACAPRSLGAVCPGASSAGPPEASAGKVVQARQAVAWQAPVGPSDDGIRGSMDASAPDERKTPVTGVLIFVGRAERPGVRRSGTRTGVPLCAHRRRPGRHHLHDRPLKPIGPPHGRRTARSRRASSAEAAPRAPSASLPTMRPSLALFRSGFNPS